MNHLLATAVARLGVALLGAALLGADAAEYHWPLELPRVLTSSFAEYRPGRFHMGIDLRTGPIGQNVFAAEAGYVSRIRCSPFGYGKAVYLTLNDGNSVVYAHLDDFAPALRDYVRAGQHARRSYTVDLQPGKGEFPVARGDFIAKSGQTGIGVPHLHYEIRDAAGSPINPKLLGIEWPDTTAPVFRSVMVIPLSPDASVNGDLVPARLAARANGRAFTTDPVAIEGPVGFAVDVIDPANNGATRLGVHTIETRAGDRIVFRLVHDRVDYETSGDGAVAYHPYFPGRFLTQYRWEGNDLAMYRASPSDGVYAPDATDAAVTMTARDFLGNESILNIPLAAPKPAAESAVTGTGASGSISFDTFGTGLVVTVLFNAPEAEIPTVTVDQSVGRPMRRISDRLFRQLIPVKSGGGDWAVRVLHTRVDGSSRRFIAAGRGGKARRVQWGDVGVTIQPDSAYGSLVLQVREDTAAPTKALKSLGKSYEVWHADTPLEAPIELSLPAPNASPRSRVYRRSDDEWSIISAAQRRNGRFEFSTRELGTFAVFEDTAAPVIQVLSPADGATLTTRRPEVRARVDDAGSGVDAWSLEANGKWLLASYDPEEGIVEWEADEDLEGDTVELVFYLNDAAGNATEIRRRVDLAMQE